MNSLFYKDYGNGPDVVLLHGFCESHEIWSNIIPELSKQFRVVAIDLPGFGSSPILPTPFSIKEVGEAVISLLESLKIQSCTLIGHSLGGYVALSITEEKPDLLAGLCLFHSTAQADTEEKKQNRNKVIEFVGTNGVEPYVETFVPGLFFQKDPDQISQVYNIAIRTSKKALLGYLSAMRDRPDRVDALRNMTLPILFIAGARDSIIPESALLEQSKITPFGKLELLGQTGHMGMFEEAGRSIQILKDFLTACFRLPNR